MAPPRNLSDGKEKKTFFFFGIIARFPSAMSSLADVDSGVERPATPCFMHWIDEHGKYNDEIQRMIESMSATPASTAASSSLPAAQAPALTNKFVVVAVLGPQSSGKSTLLNKMYKTVFPVLDAGTGRHQTTRGVYATLVDNRLDGSSGMPMVIVDMEGSDGIERAIAEEENLEKKLGLFALSLADVLMVNVWFHDIGRNNASNFALLRNVISLYLKIFAATHAGTQNWEIKIPRKLQLLFVIRDYEHEKTPLDATVTRMRQDMAVLWQAVVSASSLPHLYDGLGWDSLFDLHVHALSHFIYRPNAFQEDVDRLRDRVREMAFQDIGPKTLPLADLPEYARHIWSLIEDNKDIDVPSQQDMHSRYRCLELGQSLLHDALAGSDSAAGPLTVQDAHLRFGAFVVAYLDQTSFYCRRPAREVLLQLSERFFENLRELTNERVDYLCAHDWSVALTQTLDELLPPSPFPSTSSPSLSWEAAKAFWLGFPRAILDGRLKSDAREMFDADIGTHLGRFSADAHSEVDTADEVFPVQSGCGGPSFRMSVAGWHSEMLLGSRNAPGAWFEADVWPAKLRTQLAALSRRSFSAWMTSCAADRIVQPPDIMTSATSPDIWDTLEAYRKDFVDVARLFLLEDLAAGRTDPDFEQIERLSRTVIEARVRETLLLLPVLMRQRFDRVFRYLPSDDGPSRPRVWTATDNVDRVFEEAKASGLALLDIFSRWMPADGSQARLVREIFEAGIAGTFLDAKHSQELRAAVAAQQRGNGRIPHWLLFLIIALGWNEFMSLLNHPFLFLFLLLIVGLVVAASIITRIPIDSIVDAVARLITNAVSSFFSPQLARIARHGTDTASSSSSASTRPSRSRKVRMSDGLGDTRAPSDATTPTISPSLTERHARLPSSD